MKKKHLLFVLSVFCCVMSFISCESPESPKMKISPSHVTLHFEEEVGLSVIDNHSDVTWATDDEFVASVDNSGIIKAEHVGTTTIIAKDGDDEAYCSVSVTPKYYTYNEPIMDWGCSKETIISKKGTPDVNQSNALTYVQSESNGIVEMYMFESGKLTSSAVALRLSYANTDVANFLIERYHVIGGENDNYYFSNALTLEDTTLGVYLMVDDYILVTYAPWDGSSNNLPARCPAQNSTNKQKELIEQYYNQKLSK